MAIILYESKYADGEAVDAALDKAESAVQPADLGTAAAEDVGAFATAAQGGLAATAVQPGSLGTAAAQNVGYFATAAQGGKADSALQPDAPARLGSATNYTNIAADGTLTLGGAATYWDDLIGGIASAVTSGPGVTLSQTELTLDFVAAANTADYAWLNFQLEHRWKAGSPIFPHLHFEQTQTNIPNWLVQYRWQRQGQAKTTAWSNYKCNTSAFTWASGTLNQICYGAGITPPANYGMSDILQLRLVRDSTNTSTLFAGADPNNATQSVSAFDVHIECDALGSASEYVK